MKTITLEEAFAKATKGPFEIEIGQGIETNIVQPETRYYGNVAKVYGTYNAALLAHCFNHFQELVEALEKMARLHYDEGMPTLEGLETIKKAESALAKAKQVQML